MTNNSTESNKNADSAFNKNMTTDTPRTDAIFMECPSHLQEVELANLAIDLERELAASLKNQLKTECDLLQSQDINWFLDTEFRIACKRAEKAEAEVEFWKAKAYEAEFYEGKHEAEVERLNGQLKKRVIEIAEQSVMFHPSISRFERRKELDQIKERICGD